MTVPPGQRQAHDPDSGDRKRFSSAIVPPWARKSPEITEVLPLLYLHGLSSGDFVPALGQFLGSSAVLSAAVITKLTETLFDADDSLEAIEFGRPDGNDDAITYDGLDVFTTPVADLVTQVRQRTTIHVEAEGDGQVFTAPGLLLSLWLVTPKSPDDQEGRFFGSVLIARPGYHDQLAKPDGPTRE